MQVNRAAFDLAMVVGRHFDEGADCEEAVAFVALDPPENAVGGLHAGGLLEPQEEVGVQVHGQEEVRSRGSGHAVAEEVVRGGDAELLGRVRLVEELALAAAVARGREEVGHALFDGRVADGFIGAARGVVQASVAGYAVGDYFLAAVGNVTGAVDELVGRQALDADQGGRRQPGVVQVTAGQRQEAALAIRAQHVARLAEAADVGRDIEVNAETDLAVKPVVRRDPRTVAEKTGCAVRTVGAAVSDVDFDVADTLVEHEVVFNRETVSTAIVRQAALRNRDASLARVAPRVAGAAETAACGTIVAYGAVRRNVIARVCGGAPASARLEGQADPAVAGGATSRNRYARLLRGAPLLVGSANALSGLTVMARRAISGYVVARVRRGAPASAGFEGQALATHFAGLAASRCLDALLFQGAEDPPLLAKTLAGFAVVVVGAVGGDVVARVRETAPARPRVERHAPTAIVMGQTT